MVKIRLRRMGTKGRPFYRIVVAKSTAGRDGSFIDIIGTHNPILKDKENRTKLNGEKALKWLLEGAQPTETVAYMLHKAGVLDQFFAQRPAAKAKFKSIDKRTSSISQVTAIDQAKAEQKAEAAKEEAAVAVAEPEVATEAEAPTEA